MVSAATMRDTERIFREHGNILRFSEAIRLGILKRHILQLYETGHLVRISRGLYRLADVDSLTNHDLVVVASRAPHAIVCLISALSFHGITTEIPHSIYLAMLPRSWAPLIDHPPVRVFRFSGASFSEGVEPYTLDGVSVNIYSAAKTVADCFKFRNKIGLDVAIEGLRLSLERRVATHGEILHYARICRVERIIKPYMEAMI